MYFITEPPAKPVGPIIYNKTTHSSVTLSWKNPNEDGGLPITGYAVSVLDTSNGEWRDVGVTAENVTTFCVPKLPEDTEVRVKVSAMNEAGSSTPLIGGKVRTKLKETSSYGRFIHFNTKRKLVGTTLIHDFLLLLYIFWSHVSLNDKSAKVKVNYIIGVLETPACRGIFTSFASTS